MAVEKVEVQEEDVARVEIVRPRRAAVSEEEALTRMNEFPEQRKEQMIATVRKGKS